MLRPLLTGLLLTLLLLLHHSSCLPTAPFDAFYDEEEPRDRLSEVLQRVLALEQQQRSTDEEDWLRPKRGSGPGMTLNTAEILFHALKKPRTTPPMRNRMSLKGLSNLFKTGRKR